MDHTDLPAAPELPSGFDWFGQDRAGQYAIFVTAGGGAVPLGVRGVADKHDGLRAGITVPGVLQPEFPRHYARVGLFVYTWSQEEGDYRRFEMPRLAVPSSLRVELSHCTDIPQLAVDDFGQAETIKSDAWILKRTASKAPGDDAGHDWCPKCGHRFATRTAIVNMTDYGLVSDAELASTWLQCPHCRHRFRARTPRFRFPRLDLTNLGSERGVLWVLILVSAVALSYAGYRIITF